jgi:hypothetical protein
MKLMKMKWICIVPMVAALLLAGGTPAVMAGKKKHKLKIAQTLYPTPSAHMASIQNIADEITKQTDGRIKFKVYGPELGDWAELNEMVNRGDIDMMLSPMSATYDPRWNVTFAPYIVTGYDEAKQAFGPGGFMDEIFTQWAKDVNMKWMGTWIQGFAGVSLSAKAATTAADAKGIKIRTPPIAAFECYWKKLGFTPSLIPYYEFETELAGGGQNELIGDPGQAVDQVAVLDLALLELMLDLHVGRNIRQDGVVSVNLTVGARIGDQDAVDVTEPFAVGKIKLHVETRFFPPQGPIRIGAHLFKGGLSDDLRHCFTDDGLGRDTEFLPIGLVYEAITIVPIGVGHKLGQDVDDGAKTGLALGQVRFHLPASGDIPHDIQSCAAFDLDRFDRNQQEVFVSRLVLHRPLDVLHDPGRF